MKLHTDQQEKYTIVKLSEPKLNSLNAPDLKAHFIQVFNDGTRNIIIDLSQVEYVDSSGLSAILSGNRFAKNSNGSFVIAGTNDGVSKIIKISQLDKVFHLTPTVHEAIELVIMEEIERDLTAGE